MPTAIVDVHQQAINRQPTRSYLSSHSNHKGSMGTANIGRLVLQLMYVVVLFVTTSQALSNCGGPCSDLNDCYGQLICINGKCNDDPDVGTHICSGGGGGGGGGSGGGGCSSSGSLTCKGISYQTYACSPPVTSSTAATLTNNNFEKGGDGGGPSECDGQYHSNADPIVALSTGWYAGGSRCGRMIRITARNGRSVDAKVVDECDSQHGCDAEHAGQPPCKNNIVDGSQAVWDALGLNVDVGVEPVTWSMA